MAALGAIGRSRKPIYKRKIFDLWQSDPGSATPRRYSHKSWLRPQAVFPLAGDFLNAIKVPNNGIIGGITQENGVIISRCVVRLYHRKSGYLAGETISDDSGNFIFRGLDHTNPEQWLIVALDPSGGESYNALIQDKITPFFDTSTVPARTLSASGIPRKPTEFGTTNISGVRWAEAVLSFSPVVYYQMNETTGSVLNDSSGNGVHGTIGSGVAKNQAGLRNGNVSMFFFGSDNNGAQSSYGNNSLCWVPWNSLLGITADDKWSFSCIVKAIAGGTGSIMRRIAGLSGNSSDFYFAERGNYFNQRLAGNVDYYYPGRLISPGVGETVQKDTVYRIFVVRNGSTLTMYSNGVLQDTIYTNVAPAATPREFHIGGSSQYPGSYNFRGYISDVALFDYALTPAQIAQIESAA